MPAAGFILLCLAFYTIAPALHARRKSWSLAPLYVFLGFSAAAMIYLTDIKAYIQIGSLRFLIGSSVCFVTLLLTIFIIYTFESLRAAQVAMGAVLAISILFPLLKWITTLIAAPIPNAEIEKLRLYTASTTTMALSFVIMTSLWQWLHNRHQHLPDTLRVFITLSLTLAFDSILFVTGAFWDNPEYTAILQGHLFNRLVISTLAAPILSLYLAMHRHDPANPMDGRNHLAILQSSRQTEMELLDTRRELQLRKQAEAALRQSEQRYRALFTHSPIGILHFDMNAIVGDCNERLAEIIGVPRQRLLGFDMLKQLKNESMKKAVTDALDGRMGFFNDYYQSITSGKKLWLRCQMQCLTDQSGQQIGGVGIFDDLTEQKNIQESLQENEKRVRTMLAEMPVGILIVDSKTNRIKDANPAAVKMSKKTYETLKKLKINELLETDNDNNNESGQQENRLLHNETESMEIIRSTVEIELDGCAHQLEILIDNSEHKRAENALKRRDAILEAVNYAAERFLEGTDPEPNVNAVLKRLGAATQVSRVYIFTNHTGPKGELRMSQTFEWCGPDAEPQMDNPELQDVGYDELGFQRWAKLLSKGHTVHGNIADFPKNEQKMLAPQGILSILVTPILLNKHFWGFIGFDQCKHMQQWTNTEVETLHGAGRALGMAIARRNAERAVRQSEERLDLALRGASLGTWNWNIKTGRVDFNQGWAQMLGYTLQELQPHVNTWENALHPDDKENTINALQAHMQGHADKYESEHRLRTKNGKWIWVLDRGRVVDRDPAGHPLKMAGTHLDITKRKQLDAELNAVKTREQETESRIEEVLLRGQLPKKLQGIEISALSVPSQHMDGDFYDFFEHGPHCCDILVGDVMGKGIQAALVGAAAKTRFLRALGETPYHQNQIAPNLKNIVQHVHDQIAPQLLRLERFITLVYARIDLEKEVIELADCGHMRTIHYQTNTDTIQMIEGKNMPVGFVNTENIQTVSNTLNHNDLLLFYSDGVTEATNAQGEFFDEARLTRFVREHRHLSPNALIHNLRGEVANFAEKETFHDDFTCIAIRIGSTPSQKATIQIDSDLTEMPRMRQFFNEITEKISTPEWNEKRTQLMTLAVQETIVNIIEHGLKNQKGHTLRLEAEWDTEHLTLAIFHQARVFQSRKHLSTSSDAVNLTERGRGLDIIAQSVDASSSGQIDNQLACTTMVWHLK